MKILIAEDDSATQKLMQRYLSSYGDCTVAADGEEAVNAFVEAQNRKQPYELLCLDIMMPKMSGHQVLQDVRRIEGELGISGLDGVKIVMTTALGDSKNVIGAFREGCEAYVVKPVKKEKLYEEMEKLGLIKRPVCKLV
jgi:two-component system, chemotaxis family, chemotaxis protein CheY